MSGGTLDLGSYIRTFAYRALTSYGLPFQAVQLILLYYIAGPQPLKSFPLRFGLFPFRSPLLRKSMILSLPPGT